MGVPALFRWLSKKYPKIVLPVAEEEEGQVPDEEGNVVTIPVDITKPNPNKEEFDNLYLDMNGIVHPCTHPEGKPPPETEGEMMIEIFKYTERVVNMIRPRKLLFMAIDGVAPRAKMNQQRSRRFRSAQEAKEKDEKRAESIAIWESMGQTLSEDEKNKKSWDTNAITPGTPFMDFLAASLRYWVVQKMNTDPGWKQLEVIISDASVPGEGEHKIMDYIRRQRSHRGHDPNTKHVIYGLDADLIMLALATHEPHFKVLREDVFAQANSTACRMCGEEGHYAAQCTGPKPDAVTKKTNEKKPFIFLDVSILREYLAIELNVTQAPFPFDLEMAIDDWVLMIFFVGNDFLPHLPSLEIREGAIDTLLRIWKDELPRMGGYITNHGQLVLSRAEIILWGLARREDDIFRRRREGEERQHAKEKERERQKEASKRQKIIHVGTDGPSPSLQLTSSTDSAVLSNNFAAKADSIGLGGPKTEEADRNATSAVQALAGTGSDVVANRAAIRLANMSAAETLKAEMAGLMPAKRPSLPAKPVIPSPSLPALPTKPEPDVQVVPVATPVQADPAIKTEPVQPDVPGLGNAYSASTNNGTFTPTNGEDVKMEDPESSIVGRKRPLDETETDQTQTSDDLIDEDIAEADDEPDNPEDAEVAKKALGFKVNPDGTVEQEDTVKLWEPGYKERYYRQKFGVERSDAEFRKKVTFCYIQGLAWVLAYYYQGTPSWQWFYPFHFAPFAADFEDVAEMNVSFEKGEPFKPYEQLMGVFPASSRQHIPSIFHPLMTEENSPIIDFYPLTFDIDMNGKRMAWQGVALLPFIDQKRLLDAMALHYPNLSEDEVRRNQWGHDVLFTSEEHPLYPFLETLYGKKKIQEPIPIDPSTSRGLNGSLLPNPDCIPGSTYSSPLTAENLPDIPHDRTLSAIYFFPTQAIPHRSVILPGARPPPRTLTANDIEVTRRGGSGRGRGRGGGHPGNDFGGHASTFASQTYYGSMSSSYSSARQQGNGDRGSGSYSRGPSSHQQQGPSSYSGRPSGGYPSQQSYGTHGNYGGYQSRPPPPPSYNSGGYSNGRGGGGGSSYGGGGSGAYGSATGSSYGRGGSRGTYNNNNGGRGRGGYNDYPGGRSSGSGYGAYSGGGGWSNGAPQRGRGRGGFY